MSNLSRKQLMIAGSLCLGMAAVGTTAMSAVGTIDSNRSIPMNDFNSGMGLPLSNPTGSVTTPIDAATLAALNSEWTAVRENYIRLGQQITEPEMNMNSEGLIRDMSMRLQILNRQTPPAAAGLTGSDRTMVVNEFRGELATMEDQLDRVIAALQMDDNEAAWEEFSQIRLMHGERYGLQ